MINAKIDGGNRAEVIVNGEPIDLAAETATLIFAVSKLIGAEDIEGEEIYRTAVADCLNDEELWDQLTEDFQR
jgi:hypothetical protein